MLTKYTINYPTKRAFFPAPPADQRPDYGQPKFEEGMKEAKDIAECLTKIAGLISYLMQYPDSPIETAIRVFFGSVEVTITPVTKTRRIYHIPFLYLHEEDTVKK